MKNLHDDQGKHYTVPEEVLDAFMAADSVHDMVLLRPIKPESRERLAGLGGEKQRRTATSGSFDGIQIYWCDGGFVLK